jgi:hypothetical protein
MEKHQNDIVCYLHMEDPFVDPEVIPQWTMDLKNEMVSTNLIDIIPTESLISPSGTKGIDPMIAAISFSMLSNSLPQILVFLHDWALRREGRVLKIKIQSKKDKFIEMEIPTALSKKEVKDWIETIQSAME